MRVRLEDLKRMITIALLSVPAVAFIMFSFVFPNISTPSMDRNMLVAFLLSILFGMPAGYFTRRTDMALLTVLIYVAIGYVLAILAYSAPFLFYEFRVIFPGLYFMFFFNRTVILLLLFVLGGIVGVVLGQIVRESTQTEETSQWFSKERA